ncbi:hypothetical protein HYALB_00011451 [Hymenoscyphus albidus]|uniref:Peptidase M43 pregnancy-associated plasma-A domain-containing protein n=1 Tax=Hymenoscyphus albidus TaxID=595503 RepID=A0A9N9LXL3_9HELO|nr:hypothetical protein HYALB_00011451 [Hymenoscyphus albidus]
MRFTAAIFSLAVVAPVFAHPAHQARSADVVCEGSGNLVPAQSTNASPCNTEPSPEFLAAVAYIAAAEANGTLGTQNELNSRATVTIQTYFHVVASAQTVAGGYVTAAQISQQMDYLNSAYASTGYAFVNAGVDYTINAGWARDGSELAMKKALRKGTYKDLNIYFQLALQDDALGYCYFPVASHSTTSDNFAYDGCSIQAGSIAGGTLANYNLGGTVAHEVGHWMGLLHTFQGAACSSTNDGIADTPAQNGYTQGCPSTRDSCPNAAGLDPIHNYMDYSYDVCYTEFTPNQITRMNSMWTTYRA